MKLWSKKIIAILLSIIMIISLGDMGGIRTAYAGEEGTGEVTTIIYFNDLDENVKNQEIVVGAEESAINLPNTLTVTTSVSGSAITLKENVSILVTWEPMDKETGFNSSMEGSIVYVPVIDSSYLIKDGLTLPRIHVNIVSSSLVVANGSCGATDSDSLTWAVTGAKGSYTLTISGSGAMKDYSYALYSPEEACPWYQYSSEMNTLILSDGITYIGNYAFNGCSFTGNLTIPNSVKGIGYFGFGSCDKFNGSLTLSTALETIRDYAFAKCSGFIGSLNIPDNVTSIGNDAFSHCSGFTGTLTLSAGLTIIENSTFGYCNGFTGTLNIPDGIETIGSYAFYNCGSFSKAVIPAGVENLYSGAFAAWKTDCTIYNYSGLYMGNYAYNIINYYKVITVVDGVSSLYGTFLKGSAVTVTDPAKESAVFEGWYTDSDYATPWDSSIVINENITIYAKFATLADQGTCGDNLKWSLYGETDNYTLIISGSGAMTNYNIGEAPWEKYKASTKKLEFKNGLTSIGTNAFYYYNSLEGSLILPDSVVSIGSNSFNHCSSLKGNLVLGAHTKNIESNAFTGCGFTGTLTIPNELEKIGNGAFYACSGFTGDLILPDSIVSMEASAFTGCYGFDGSLTLSNQLKSIEDRTFLGCRGFKGSLTIPEGVKKIGAYAFEDCNGFNGILTILKNVETIGEHAFNSCLGFSQVTLPASINKDAGIGNQAFSNWKTGSLIYNLSDFTLINNTHYSGANLGTVYLVTTYMDGEAISTTKFMSDGTGTVTIVDPVKEGYAFKGWYTDPSFTNTWEGNGQVVTANLNLYAKFQKIISVSDITSITNSSIITYDGTTKEIPVTINLSGYAPDGTEPASETVKALAKVSSRAAGIYTSYILSDLVFTNGEKSNYTLTGVTDGTLTITNGEESSFGIRISKKVLTVTAKDITFSVGDSMNSLTVNDVTIAGFAGSEDSSVLGGELIFTFSEETTNKELSNGTVTPGGYESNNYDISYQSGKLTIAAKKFGNTPYIASGDNNGQTGSGLWYLGDITLTPDTSYCGNFSYISISLDKGKTWSDFSATAIIPAKTEDNPGDTDTGSALIRLATGKDSGNSAVVTLNDAFTYKLDTTPQTGTITIEEIEFRNLLNTITFGLLFNKTVTVSIKADSTPTDLSGGATCYLYKDSSGSASGKSYKELKNLEETSDISVGWVKTNSFDVTADEKFVAYGKIVDGAGNSTYLNSTGIMVDKTNPTISGFETPEANLLDVSAKANMTESENGSYYYAVIGSEDTPPADGPELEEWTKSSGIVGSGEIDSDKKTEINLSGLTANTDYILLAAIKDQAGNFSLLYSIPFKTKKTIPVIFAKPSIKGIYGQKVCDMTLTEGVVKSGETVVDGEWSIASQDIPAVEGTNEYTVTFTPTIDKYEAITVQIVPVVAVRSLSAAGVTVSEITDTYTYDGLAKEPAVTLTDSNAVLTSEDYSITYSNNISAGKGTVTVKGKNNYKGEITREFIIQKASALTLTDITKSYVYSKGCNSEIIEISELLPPDKGSAVYSVTGVTDDDEILKEVPEINLNGTLTFSVNKGTLGNTTVIPVTISMTNYEDSTVNIIARLADKTSVNLNGITIADKTYDGEAITLEGTLIIHKIGSVEQLNIDDLVYSYTSTDGKGYESSNPPKEAGSYQLVISVTESNTDYRGSLEPLIFKINKKALTVTAIDKNIFLGEKVPSLANPVKDTDYTVTGLAGSDVLGQIPSLQYVVTPDNTKAGNVVIEITGGEENANYSITYVNAVINIKQTYTVTFDSVSGSAVASETVKEGYKLTVPNNPTKSGYTFGGWYKEETCINSWNFNADTVTNDMTLYSKWINNSSNYTSGGGNASSDSEKTATPAPVVTEKEDGSTTVTSTETTTDRAANISVSLSEAVIQRAAKEMGKGIDLTVTIPTEEVIRQLANENIKEVNITLTLPELVTKNDNINLSKILLTEEVLAAAKRAEKTVRVTVKTTDGDCTWIFDKALLSNSVRALGDTNLFLSTIPISNLDKTDNLKQIITQSEDQNQGNNDNNKNVKGIVLDFNHSGLLPSTAKVKLYVAGNPDVTGIKAGSKVFLYYYDKVTEKLSELPTMEYTVDEDGYVTVDITHCSEYVLLPVKAQNGAISLLDQVKVNKKAALYLGDSNSNKQDTISLPDTMVVVKKFSKTSDPAIIEAKITYKSSNSRIVSINSNGRLTGKKKGSATITITVKLSDGTKRTYTQKITVKKFLTKAMKGWILEDIKKDELHSYI